MATTTFYDGQTVIYAAWLNDVNTAVYNGSFPNGVLTVTTINATNVNTTNLGFTSITLPNNWAITTTSTKMYFSYSGNNVASLDTSGNFIALASFKAPITVAQTGITP